MSSAGASPEVPEVFPSNRSTAVAAVVVAITVHMPAYFAASIGVERLCEPERQRVLTTQRIDQQLVLDYWRKPLTESPTALQAEFDALLDRVTVPYLWLAGGTVDTADRDHLLAHVAQSHIETWSNLGHMAHLAAPDRWLPHVTLARRVPTALVGAVLEKITGKPWYQLVDERIAKPLGLTTIRYGVLEDRTPNMATPRRRAAWRAPATTTVPT